MKKGKMPLLTAKEWEAWLEAERKSKPTLNLGKIWTWMIMFSITCGLIWLSVTGFKAVVGLFS